MAETAEVAAIMTPAVAFSTVALHAAEPNVSAGSCTLTDVCKTT